MIYAKKEINTQFIPFQRNKYCAYCGKAIEPDTEIDHGERTEYFHCDCPDALKEIEIREQIKKLSEEIDTLRYSLPQIKFRLETKPQITKI